ncbi:MAG: barstar family protein [Alphaproteobacteria bacterium]
MSAAARHLVRIDGRAVRSLADAYTALAEALVLPAHFGRNLDALFDALTGDVAGPLELEWANAAATRAALGRDFERLVAVFREVAAAREDFTFRLV